MFRRVFSILEGNGNDGLTQKMAKVEGMIRGIGIVGAILWAALMALQLYQVLSK